MPEVTPDASLIVAISWQALSRAESGGESTRISNCTVVIVFAAFFVEATLNHFIEQARAKGRAADPPEEHDGLHKKIAWVYNSFVADAPSTDPRLLSAELEATFPRFEAIRRFRNGVAHGVVDRSGATRERAKELRIAAKAIVSRLLEIAEDKGIPMERAVDYKTAIREP